MVLRHGDPASNSFPMALTGNSFFPMALRHGTSGQQQLRHSAPASNKPHPAEKRTPVWLAIWRTWAGFANSQLRHAPFLSLYLYMCLSALLPPWSRCSDRRKSLGPSAPIAYATSVSPPDEAAAWPRCSGVGCWMRLLPGKGAGDGWQIMLLVVRVAVPANHRAL